MPETLERVSLERQYFGCSSALNRFVSLCHPRIFGGSSAASGAEGRRPGCCYPGTQVPEGSWESFGDNGTLLQVATRGSFLIPTKGWVSVPLCSVGEVCCWMCFVSFWSRAVVPFYSLGLRLALPPHELLFAAPSVFFFFFFNSGCPILHFCGKCRYLSQ